MEEYSAPRKIGAAVLRRAELKISPIMGRGQRRRRECH